MLAGTSDGKLISSLTDFVNFIPTGKLPLPVREIIFDGIALQKKVGGIRPIAIGNTLRRLAAKCANKHIIERRSNELSPFQVGVGVAGGAEAAVHAIRRLTDDLSDDNVLVKLDFVNAFNTVRTDTILDTVADKAPEIYVCVSISLLRVKESFRTLHLVSRRLSARRSSECARILRRRSANIARVQVTDEVGLYGRPQAQG